MILSLFDEVPKPLPPASLPERLYRLGLDRGTPVVLTRNRTVMMSWRPRTGLRLHAGYSAAPDEVLLAIVRFLARRVRREDRAAARRRFMAFPADAHVPSRAAPAGSPRAVEPEDQPLLDRLSHLHELLNVRHFGGNLATIPIRLSHRMRRHLGEFRGGATTAIVISRRHVRRDGWAAAVDTLLHEMVHQWQAEQGLALDHGREFRQKAREVGIVPRAMADLVQRG